MDIISQTNRTMLFEEVNPEKMDLLTLVGSVNSIESLSDEKIKEIHDHLCVDSFDEFLDKFEPTVYCFYNAANQKIMYTLERPEGVPDESISEIPLGKDNDFLNMLFTLLDTKKTQGVKNVDFKFENVLDMISPEKIMEDIKLIRKEIDYLYSNYADLEDEDPKKRDIGDKLNLKFEQASKNYNNILGMLPLAIEDIKTRLLLGRDQEDSDAEPIEAGVLSMGEEGELEILEAPDQEEEQEALVAQEEANKEALIEAFEEDYEAISEEPNDYVKDLVVRTFAPLSENEVEIDVEKQIENYNQYLKFYKQSKDDFVEAAKPLLEKILGVKMFFDQYDVNGRSMPPSLFVTNCKLEMMVKSNNRPRLETFLQTVNSKNNFENTVWFGIVPNVKMDSSDEVEIRRQRFEGSEDSGPSQGNSLGDLTALLNVAKDYKIQVFFNFEANDKTTFKSLATNGVSKYINKSENLTDRSYSEYAIPCLPNFTVIPKNKSGVVLDKKMKEAENGEGAVLSEEEEDIFKLWLEGVYIDASYVAAGLVAAYQCPDYLDKKFRKVSNQFPGVRFDLESQDHNLVVTTTLAKEISGFTNKIKKEINRNNFGFVFSSDNAKVDGDDVRRIVAYKTRNLSKLPDGGYDSIYKTLVSTYVERVLRFRTNDFKEDNIVKFFSQNPKSQKSRWVNNRGYKNSVLQTGDEIEHEIDEETGVCQIDLIFNGNVKNMEVNISKSTSQ